ncbi:two-component system OmpR family sensor kinase [Pseudoduganella flava]|uniref:histidine kinase n=1 Tax=Pseudoduganella flava TaxID=871742 RepID=A0A562PG88_9BURK|nr:ATP-binding protein [Pseudoduganella flava]QGZ40280.1 two-component sensor histidine kinase [Pseudoduganella flava]TWI43464.1 two-component system OmpR family sensor kinase [Pseudoduganella flava]
MNRLFFRLVILVMLSISVAAFIVYFTINRLFGDPLENIARNQAAAQIFLLEQYVDQAPADGWLDRLNKVREVSDVRFDLIPISVARQQLSRSDREAFDRGEVVIDIANKSLLRRVDLTGDKYIGSDEEAIHAQNLPIDIKVALQMEALRYLIVALALLIPIGVWSRSHWHGLQVLMRVADKFGAGQLKVRVQMKPGDSIYPLAERINHMADRIETLLESQRGLLHSVSHEIRTPIARLEFAFELLHDMATGGAGDTLLQKRIGSMQDDLTELKSLVNELLGMARLDSDQPLRYETFDLTEALRSCANSLPPAAVSLDVSVPDGMGTYYGDCRLLMRATGNLLRNAQKYGNSKVALSAARKLGAVSITVDDDGPGIPEEEREKVFEPFYRLDRSRDRGTGGFGLGLSIAAKAVSLHGGSLKIDTSPLGGARFTITLPPA